MDDDNIIQFPGNQREHVQVPDGFMVINPEDMNISITWDDLELSMDDFKLGLNDFNLFLDDRIAQDQQLASFQQKLEALYALVEQHPELCQFTDRYIESYLEHLRKKLQ